MEVSSSEPVRRAMAAYRKKRDVRDDDFINDNGKNTHTKWGEYWRLMFPKVTINDIENFEHQYKGEDLQKGSANEKEDLKKAYLNAQGDMDLIMESMICSTSNDEPRFIQRLEKFINKRDVPDFPAFTNEPPEKKRARQRKAAKAALDSEVLAKKLKLETKSNTHNASRCKTSK